VTLKASVGEVELTAPGVARQEGGRGEYIRVFNTQTRTSVICRIIDAQTVLVGKAGE
jgi:flagella basal body P-ring formation protein FlgA